MRAMRLERLHEALRMEEFPSLPPKRGEVRISVAACGVCRTDLHLIDGELPNALLPITPGHEIVGYVSALGEDTTLFRLGDRVGIPWLGWVCGHCEFCRGGHENLCPFARFTGCQIDGGFATEATADERFVFRIPTNYSDEEAAPLLCAGLIGWRALAAAGGSLRLGIFGFGAAAHIVAQVAASRGQHVFAFVRPGDDRAATFARRMGAVWAGGSNEPSTTPLDAAIIFAPVGELIPAALRAVRPGGIVICGGIHMSDIPSFPYSILWGERILRSVANLTRRDAEEFLAFAGQTKIEIASVGYRLADANIALSDLRNGQLSGAAVLMP
jgi:alcohol dehydrogenase, propanol-preferring